MRMITFALAMLFGIGAHAQTYEHLASCGRWSGGMFTEEDSEQWRRPGFGIESAPFNAVYFRTQDHKEKQFDDPAAEWSAWMPVERVFELEDGAILIYMQDPFSTLVHPAILLRTMDDGRLFGKIFKMPIVLDRVEQRLRSVVNDGERYVLLECKRPLKR